LSVSSCDPQDRSRPEEFERGLFVQSAVQFPTKPSDFSSQRGIERPIASQRFKVFPHIFLCFCLTLSLSCSLILLFFLIFLIFHVLQIEAREMSVHIQASPESPSERVLHPVNLNCTIALNDFLQPPKFTPQFELFLRLSPIKGQMNRSQYPHILTFLFLLCNQRFRYQKKIQNIEPFVSTISFPSDR
jgi:hypothetical protein